MHQIRRKASGDTVCSCRCGFDVPVILRSSEETESILPPPEKQMVQVTNPFGLELTSGPASVTGKNMSRNVEALTSEPGMNQLLGRGSSPGSSPLFLYSWRVVLPASVACWGSGFVFLFFCVLTDSFDCNI